MRPVFVLKHRKVMIKYTDINIRIFKMAEKKNNRLVSWLLTRPALFAVIAFVLMTAASALAGLLGAPTASTRGVIIVLSAFLGATGWLLRKFPLENLDRRSFVAISNAQTLITSVAFIASTFIIAYNAQPIMMQLLWLESYSPATFLAIIILLALFYLYLCGIFIGNLYAKYRRIRAMGVSMWKTLATAPFGFCMLWIPGYLMDDAPGRANVMDVRPTWYARFTNWVISRPWHAALVLVVMIIISGFTFGFNAILLTFGLGLVFAIWSAVTGSQYMRKNIGGIYATTAIIINVITLVATITYFSLSHNNKTPAYNIAPTTQNAPENTQ